jgi:hypothetical protein
LLCEMYWHPVLNFLRRRAASEEQAEDLTQGFFERLVKRLVDRGRAKELVDKAVARLRAEHAQRGKVVLFDHLKRKMLDEQTEMTDAELCVKLNRRSGSVGVAFYRLQHKRFVEAVMAELKEESSVTARHTPREELRVLVDALT